MPKRSTPGVMAGEGNVAEHVQTERELRGWSTAVLANQVTMAGCPISQSAIWRIENGNPRRKISVDELVAFSTVFGKSVEYLLQPVRREYPEDLIRLYVNKWVAAQTFVRKARIRADVDLRKLTSAAWLFPASEPVIREMIQDQVAETTGFGLLGEDYLRDFDAHFSKVREADGVHVSLSAAEIILLGRSKGETDDQILEAATQWGAGDEVAEALNLGVVHHTEPDFAGYMPLEFLEIRDGRVARSASAGRAAEASAESAAREAGLPTE